MSELRELTLEEMREHNLPPFLILAELERRAREHQPVRKSWWRRLLKL